MDRQGISSPVFHDNDGANNYITKMPTFGLQRAMRGIERLTVDIHQREARTRDYIDTKLDAQLDDIRHVWANYKSLPLRHLQGGDAQVASLRSSHKMQVPRGTVKKTFMSTREDRETTSTTSKLRLLPPLRHLRQVLSRHLCLQTYGIFAYLRRVRIHWPSSTATVTR